MPPKRTIAALFVALSSACAETGTLLDSSALDTFDPKDASVDSAGSMDSADALVDFDVPRFDVPPARDLTEEEASLDAPPDRPVDDAPTRLVDHCYLLDPRVMESAPGAVTPLVGVAVFVAGTTPGAGPGAGVTVEVGVGDGGSQPLAAGGTWRWAAASYERDIDGRGATGARDYDRYQGDFAAPTTEDEFAYAARARVGAGPWVACDFVQTMPRTYAPAFAGRLTVMAASARRVTYCNLQFPRVLSLASGAVAPTPSYGRAFADRVTNVGCSDSPSPSALNAQFGYGAEGSYPSSSTWTWSDGRYSGHRDSTNPLVEGNCANIEYQVAPRAPVDCAPRSFGWRFRLGTGPWTYCRWAPPAEGAPSTPAFDVWEPSLAGSLRVTGCP